MISLEIFRRQRKLALFVAAILLPIAIIAGVFIHGSLEGIDFARRELAGTVYLRAAWPILRDHDLDRPVDISTLDQVDRQDADYLGLDADYAGFREVAVGHEDGQAAARGFIKRVADTSNLTLDPKIDSYYLMNTATVALPAVSGAESDLRQGWEKGETDDDAIRVLAEAVEATNSSLESATRDARDQKLALMLQVARQDFNTAFAAYETRLRQHNTNKPAADLAALRADEHRFQQATDKLWLVSVNQLDRLLNERLGSARLELWLTVAIALVLGLTGLSAVVYLDLYMQRDDVLKLNAHLRQSNEELERFAYICSHDLQEPLRNISLYTGMLVEDCQHRLDEVDRQRLETIRSNAGRAQKMVRDILGFSRIGREAIKAEPIDLQRVVDQVCRDFRDKIEHSRAEVEAKGLPTVKTVPALPPMLFQNLIGNALKFQDGRRPPRISVTAVREEKRKLWRFEVRDNGIGIAAADYERVFTLFQRIHREDEYPGTGIGLSACRKFVRLVGGEMTFTSTPGEGTVFTVTLPDR